MVTGFGKAQIDEMEYVFASNNSVHNDSFGACKHVSSGVATGLHITTIVLAVSILIVLSFTVRRKRLLKNVLFGIPGIVVPVDFLGNSPHRYISMLIFAMMSGDILKFFFEHDNFVFFPHVTSCYTQAFLEAVISPLLLISYLCTKYVPLLACVGVAIPVLGSALGFLYATLLISYNLYNDVLEVFCQTDQDIVLALYLAVRAPIYVASLIVFLWFLVTLVKSVSNVLRKGYPKTLLMKKEEVSGAAYYFTCVKHLLKRKQTHDMRRDTTSYKIVATLFPFWLSSRRLPLNFVSAMIVAFFMIYQLGLLIAGRFLALLVELVSSIKQKEDRIVQLCMNFLSNDKDSQTCYNIILELTQGLAVVIPASPVVAMVICFLLLFHLYITVYKNIAETSKGKYKYMKLWPTLKLSYSWRYPGYQIAFAFTAFIIYTVWVCALGLGGVLVYLAFKHYAQGSLCTLAFIIMPVAWVVVAISAQVLLAKLVFIEESRGKFMTLTNQRILHWLSYFLFIYDAIFGLLSALLRALFTQVFSLLLMIRLDRNVLMKGFEVFDIGYKAYIGFLHLNHAYNNPVVHTFVRLISENVSHYHANLSFVPDDINLQLLEHCDLKNSKKKRVQFGPTRARNRWLVAYTLLRNPSLQPLTAARLRAPSPPLLSTSAHGDQATTLL